MISRISRIGILVMRRSIRSFDFQLAEREFGNDPSETILDEIDERVSEGI